MIFKTYIHYLRHRLINQNCKDGGSYFYRNQKYRNRKKRFIS